MARKIILYDETGFPELMIDIDLKKIVRTIFELEKQNY